MQANLASLQMLTIPFAHKNRGNCTELALKVNPFVSFSLSQLTKHGSGYSLSVQWVCVHKHAETHMIVSSVKSSNSHPDLLLIHPTTHPLFQITPVLNTGLSLSEPLQLYKGYNAI